MTFTQLLASALVLLLLVLAVCGAVKWLDLDHVDFRASLGFGNVRFKAQRRPPPRPSKPDTPAKKRTTK